MSKPDCRLGQVSTGDAPWLRIIKGLAMFSALAIGSAVSFPVQAQQAEVIKAGQETFERKCAVCHGLEGTGDGVLGPHLKTLPTNLAHLSRAHDGTFPFWPIYNKIDGRENVGAHGSREMPVWGTDEPGETTTGQLAMGQILALIFFLESIQED